MMVHGWVLVAVLAWVLASVSLVLAFFLADRWEHRPPRHVRRRFGTPKRHP